MGINRLSRTRARVPALAPAGPDKLREGKDGQLGLPVALLGNGRLPGSFIYCYHPLLTPTRYSSHVTYWLDVEMNNKEGGDIYRIVGPSEQGR